MKIANHNVVILKRFNKTPVGLKQVSQTVEKSLSNTLNSKIFDDHIQIGSSLPRSTLTFFNASKAIRPPSEIFAQPIIRAAFEIDMQTASIPWEDYEETLKNSKTNIAKVKEIHRPAKKHHTQKIVLPKNDDGLDDFLKSHRSSIREEVKSIFEMENSKPETQAKPQLKRQSRSASYLRPVKQFLKVKKSKVDLDSALFIKKYENSRTGTVHSRAFTSDKYKLIRNTQKASDSNDLNLTANFHVRIKKKDTVITESAVYNVSDSFSIFPESSLNAPYAGKFKGQKIRSKYGAMFTPAANETLTPNHFLSSMS